MLYHVILFVCIGLLMSLSTAADEPEDKTRELIVHNYMAAFNAHDVDEMLKMVTDDVQWLTIEGQNIVTETSNKEELRKGMAGYFKSCGTCQSTLAHIFSTGNRVSALEVVSVVF